MILVPDNTASAWDHPRQGHFQIAKNYERKSNNGRTVKYPWNRTQWQKAAPIASSSVHVRPTKAKPDSKPAYLSNEDIIDGDSSTAGGKHITIVSESNIFIDNTT